MATTGPHPADALIRGVVVYGGPTPSPKRVGDVIARIASAPFEARLRRVPRQHRGIRYLGRVPGAREESLFLHLVKRVMVEGQWAGGTTEADYVADLRASAAASSARRLVFGRRGGAIAAAITPTAEVVPSARLGPRPLPNLIVLYAADRGIIVNGYQFSTLDATAIPGEGRWLR